MEILKHRLSEGGTENSKEELIIGEILQRRKCSLDMKIKNNQLQQMSELNGIWLKG
jgi:hypothetical protein